MSRVEGPRVGPLTLGGHQSPSAELLPDITAVNWSATPRSGDEREFLALMRHDPSNLDCRLIYACFLNDQGTAADDVKAALLRYMCGHERYREVYHPDRYTRMEDGHYIYRRIVGGEGDGQLVPSGRLMLRSGLISEAVLSSTRASDIPGTLRVATALSAHPVERLVLHHTSQEVANLLERGQVMEGVRSLVLTGVDGGGRLGAIAPRLDEVTCSLAEAGEICKYPTSPPEFPSDRTRTLSAVHILDQESSGLFAGSWRLLGRSVTFRVAGQERSVDRLARFVEPGVTHSLQMEATITPDDILEIGKLAPHLERLSFVGCSLSDESWRTLMSYQFPTLRELQIQATQAPADIIEMLSRNAAAKNLSWIRLSENPEGLEAGMALLNDRGLFPALHSVEVGREWWSMLQRSDVSPHAPTYFGWRS